MNGDATEKLTDHDLLIRIDERVDGLHTCLKEHLRRHWAITLAAAGAGLTAVASLLIVLIRG